MRVATMNFPDKIPDVVSEPAPQAEEAKPKPESKPALVVIPSKE